MAFIKLKDWSERKGSESSADAIAMRATLGLSSVKDAEIFALTPAPIPGLGQNNGFTYELLANGGTSRKELQKRLNDLLSATQSDPALQAVRPNILPDTPQLQIDNDPNKAVALGLPLDSVTLTLTSAWRGAYVNDFIDRGRIKRTYLPGNQQFRSAPGDLTNWYIRNSNGG